MTNNRHNENQPKYGSLKAPTKKGVSLEPDKEFVKSCISSAPLPPAVDENNPETEDVD